jgi:hypothetical protein
MLCELAGLDGAPGAIKNELSLPPRSRKASDGLHLQEDSRRGAKKRRLIRELHRPFGQAANC